MSSANRSTARPPGQDFAATQADLQRQFQQEERFAGQGFDLFLQRMKLDFDREENRIDREQRALEFSINTEVALGHLDIARQQFDQQTRLQNAQFALQLVQTLSDSPEIIYLLQQGGLGELLNQQTGLNLTGLMKIAEGREQGVLDQVTLPSLATIQAMAPDLQQRILTQVAARTGIKRELILAEIQRRASGRGLATGTGPLERVPVGA